MNHVLRASLTVAVTAAATAALATGAAAAPPQRQVVVVDRVIPAQTVCDGFVIDGAFHLVREITTFTDAEGAPVRQLVHVTVDGVLTNATTGETATSTGVRVFHTDLVAGTTFTTASNTLIHDPGLGTITLGTGLLEFGPGGVLLDYHGPTDSAEYAALCDLLA
jgi:hypothetical protein